MKYNRILWGGLLGLFISACNNSSEPQLMKDVIQTEEPTQDECHNVYVVASAVMQVRIAGAEKEQVMSSIMSAVDESKHTMIQDMIEQAFKQTLPVSEQDEIKLVETFSQQQKALCEKEDK